MRLLSAMRNHFRFHIQPVLSGPEHRFQVRIGMEGLRLCDYVPAYRSAFAVRLQIEKSHAVEAEAQREAQMLEEFLVSRE